MCVCVCADVVWGISFYGLPIHLIREVYVAFHTLRERVVKFIKYRRLSRNMNEWFPVATPEQLAAAHDHTCIICREDMTANVRRLPCGHLFHVWCLRRWLETDMRCPTCRLSLQPALAALRPVGAAVAGVPEVPVAAAPIPAPVPAAAPVPAVAMAAPVALASPPPSATTPRTIRPVAEVSAAPTLVTPVRSVAPVAASLAQPYSAPALTSSISSVMAPPVFATPSSVAASPVSSSYPQSPLPWPFPFASPVALSNLPPPLFAGPSLLAAAEQAVSSPMAATAAVGPWPLEAMQMELFLRTQLILQQQVQAVQSHLSHLVQAQTQHSVAHHQFLTALAPSPVPATPLAALRSPVPPNSVPQH